MGDKQKLASKIDGHSSRPFPIPMLSAVGTMALTTWPLHTTLAADGLQFPRASLEQTEKQLAFRKWNNAERTAPRLMVKDITKVITLLVS
jgi:hypothetical protein